MAKTGSEESAPPTSNSSLTQSADQDSGISISDGAEKFDDFAVPHPVAPPVGGDGKPVGCSTGAGLNGNAGVFDGIPIESVQFEDQEDFFQDALDEQFMPATEGKHSHLTFTFRLKKKMFVSCNFIISYTFRL